MTFAPGQSGNPGGRPKGRPWRDAIERALKRKSIEGMEGVDRVADAFIEACMAGDVSALKELGDRYEGKVPQAITNDDDGQPFVVKVIRPGSGGNAE